MRTLPAVVDKGTFDAAAAVHHVMSSAVSQRVKAPDQRTGRVLLMRTKPVRPTESGEVVVRFARQLDLAPAGVDASAARAAALFRAASLLREGLVMAAVTSSAEPVTGCSVRALGPMRYVPVASPDFAREYFGGPLREAPTVAFDRSDDLQDAFAQTATREKGRQSGTALRAHLGGVCRVRRGGSGLGSGARAAGRAAAVGRALDVPLCWRQWTLDSPTLAAVARAVTEAAAGALRGGAEGHH